MQRLKTILFGTYLILIIVLLLNFRGCKSQSTNVDTTENFGGGGDPVDTTVVRQAERTGRSGDLKVTLLWDFQGDIDLHIRQPNGRTIYFNNKRDFLSGGFLDVDNREGGNGAAENIYWKKARKGEYQISIDYYSPSTSSGIAEKGECKIVVLQPDKGPQVFNVVMSTVKERKKVANIIINR